MWKHYLAGGLVALGFGYFVLWYMFGWMGEPVPFSGLTIIFIGISSYLTV